LENLVIGNRLSVIGKPEPAPESGLQVIGNRLSVIGKPEPAPTCPPKLHAKKEVRTRNMNFDPLLFRIYSLLPMTDY